MITKQERTDSDYYQIAIDGPVAAGKGTVSRLVAERLNFVYVDTGAMYRTSAYLAKQHGVDFSDEAKIAELVAQAEIDVRAPEESEKDGRLATVLLNGEDISWAIRTEDISKGASQVAALPEVRRVLVEKQQKIAVGKDVVMEGRDITYRVLPQAKMKIFLTGSDIVRSKRRHVQLLTKGEDISFEDVYKDLLERDERDMNRTTDPLKIVDDAWKIDTSDLSIEQVVEIIVGRVRAVREHS